MWFHHHKIALPSPQIIHQKLEEADKEQEKARKELTFAKKLAQEMAEMRETNHFARDWKKAMRRINE